MKWAIGSSRTSWGYYGPSVETTRCTKSIGPLLLQGTTDLPSLATSDELCKSDVSSLFFTLFYFELYYMPFVFSFTFSVLQFMCS
jgi:hypothetical protein